MDEEVVSLRCYLLLQRWRCCCRSICRPFILFCRSSVHLKTTKNNLSMAFGLHAPLAFAAVNSSKKRKKDLRHLTFKSTKSLSYPMFSFLSMVNWSCGLGNLLGHLLLQASVKEKINLVRSFVRSFVVRRRRGGGPMNRRRRTAAARPATSTQTRRPRIPAITTRLSQVGIFGVALGEKLMRGHFWAWTLVTNRMQSLPKTNFNLCNNVPVYLYQNWQDLNSSDVFRAKITQLIRGLCHECHLLF